MHFREPGYCTFLLHVAKGDIFESNTSFRSLDPDRISTILDLDRQVEHFEDAFEADHGGSEIYPGVGQRHEWAIEIHQIGGEGHERAHGKYVVDDKISAEPEHHCRANGAHQAKRQEEPATYERLPDTYIAHVRRAFAEAAYFRVVSAKNLDQQRSADVKRLVHQRVHARV